MLRTTRREFLTNVALAATGPLALARTARGQRPDPPDPAQPLEAQPGRLFLPRLLERSQEDDGPVRLRRPGRRLGARCGRADLVLLPRERLVSIT